LRCLAELREGQRRRIAALLLDTREPLGAHLLELLGIECRFAHHLGHEREHRREVLARRLDGRILARTPGIDVDARLEAVELSPTAAGACA
jgi:hypothetical protein